MLIIELRMPKIKQKAELIENYSFILLAFSEKSWKMITSSIWFRVWMSNIGNRWNRCFHHNKIKHIQGKNIKTKNKNQRISKAPPKRCPINSPELVNFWKTREKHVKKIHILVVYFAFTWLAYICFLTFNTNK